MSNSKADALYFEIADAMDLLDNVTAESGSEDSLGLAELALTRAREILVDQGKLRIFAEAPAMVEALRELVADNWTVAKINRLRCEARLILTAIDGAGDTLPDAPVPTPTGDALAALDAARGYASNPEQWNPPSPEQVAALLAMIDGKGEN